jgi:hypothetical protein
MLIVRSRPPPPRCAQSQPLRPGPYDLDGCVDAQQVRPDHIVTFEACLAQTGDPIDRHSGLKPINLHRCVHLQALTVHELKHLSQRSLK